MKTTLVSKENNEVKLTMDFTAEEFNEAVNKVYKKSRGQFAVDGFRKGKAPRSIIEKHYGEGIFYEDAINSMFSENYPGAIKELDVEVIDRPDVDFSEIGAGKPLTMEVKVAIFPVADVNNYFGVEVDQFEEEVSKDDVEKEIETLQKRNARMVVVDRPVQDGDTVLLDYSGFVGEEQFDGGTAERQELKIGSGMFIPGFEEQLVGVKSGEKTDVKVTFPEEYQEKTLAGKEAVFHCMVHEVKEEQVPDLDDEFAKDVSEFDTLEDLKKQTKEDLQKNRDMQAENAAKDTLIEKIYEENKIDVPKVMIEDEIDNMSQELDQQLRYQGLSLDQYIQYTNKDKKSFRDELREDAVKKVGTRIVLMSIADKEKIDVTDEDLDKEFEDLSKQYNMEVEKMKEALADSMDFFKKDIRVKKVIDTLYDKAKVSKKAAPKPETTTKEKKPAAKKAAKKKEDK